jgi:hypothetical protein
MTAVSESMEGTSCMTERVRIKGRGTRHVTGRDPGHTAITRLVERGVPVPIVQRFDRHADIATTMRCCSIAADVYADWVVSALGGQRGQV